MMTTAGNTAHSKVTTQIVKFLTKFYRSTMIVVCRSVSMCLQPGVQQLRGISDNSSLKMDCRDRHLSRVAYF